MRTIVGLGPLPYRTADFADSLGVKLMSVGPTPASLIEKGMIYSPTHGDLAFTVPFLDEFMMRLMPEGIQLDGGGVRFCAINWGLAALDPSHLWHFSRLA